MIVVFTIEVYAPGRLLVDPPGRKYLIWSENFIGGP